MQEAGRKACLSYLSSTYLSGTVIPSEARNLGELSRYPKAA